MALSKGCIIFGFLFFQFLALANSENFYSELEVLGPAQRHTLVKFKTFGIPLLNGYPKYMQDSVYLVKILKFNQFNLPKAQFHLQRMLKWRKEWRIDELLQNKQKYFADMQKEYPIYTDAFDREGRPICEIYFGSWSVRAAALSGKLKKLTEHVFVNCMESAVTIVAEQQAKGINVTQYIILENLEGFSIRTHICPSCIPFSVALATGLDYYYTNLAYGFWLMNTPEVFAGLFRLITPAMSPSTRAVFKVFTSNEREWKSWLAERIDFNQISHWFGGGKERINH